MNKATNREAGTAWLGLVFLLSSASLTACGIFVTFSVNHAPHIGLIGVIIVTVGATVSRTVAVVTNASVTHISRWANAIAALASASAGVLASVALVFGGTLGTFTLLVATWAAVVAVCDLLLSVNSTVALARRDFRVLALAGVSLAVVEASLPLTSVYAVGILGAFGIVAGVYSAIAGVALRLDTTPASSKGTTTT